MGGRPDLEQHLEAVLQAVAAAVRLGIGRHPADLHPADRQDGPMEVEVEAVATAVGRLAKIRLRRPESRRREQNLLQVLELRGTVFVECAAGECRHIQDQAPAP